MLRIGSPGGERILSTPQHAEKGRVLSWRTLWPKGPDSDADCANYRTDYAQVKNNVRPTEYTMLGADCANYCPGKTTEPMAAPLLFKK